jgi:hypothetical protein
MTTTPARELDRPTTAPEPISEPPLDRRIIGATALTFATLVIAQQVVRGSSAPAFDADASALSAYAAGSGPGAAVLTGMVALNIPIILFFAAGVVRAAGDRARMAALGGLGGVAGMSAVFAVLTGIQAVIVAHGEALAAAPELLVGLWGLHNLLFSLNSAVLGAAFLGLGLAAVGAGLTPRVFRFLAPVGAACLWIGAAGSFSMVDGSPVLAFHGAGFGLWVLFLLATAARSLRGR